MELGNSRVVDGRKFERGPAEGVEVGTIEKSKGERRRDTFNKSKFPSKGFKMKEFLK